MNSRRDSQDSVEIILSPRPIQHRNQPSNPASSSSSQAHPQHYQYLCIIDIKASINPANEIREITEIPLILLSTTSPSLPIIAEFHTFTQPQRNLHGTNRRKIPRQIPHESPTFSEAWQHLQSFLDKHGVNSQNGLAITCGDWDLRAMLPTEIFFHGLENISLLENWCNMKQAFRIFTGKKAHSMLRMLNLIGQELIGTHHNGIDDARNIARIARWLYLQGYVFKITSDGLIDPQDVQRQEMLKREKEQIKQAAEEIRIAKLEAGAVSPRDMFRCDDAFSRWDEDGVPVNWADGRPLSKSAVNKRRKMWKAQLGLHEKYLVWRQSLGAGK